MQRLPLVSIVTPCLNAARFLEETIQSVLAQDYPELEYLVMDAGSNDGTLEILRRYENRLRYISRPDRGTADAINKGFRGTRGEILAWLNADDTYLPQAVSRAVEALAANPEAAAVYGEGYWMDSRGEVLGRYPTSPSASVALRRECCICQPACFIRRKPLEDVGLLNADLHASFDYDLWIRLTKQYRLVHIPEYLAKSRMHIDNKTLATRQTVFTESIGLLARHYDYVPVSWVYGYLSFLRDQRDQFFQSLQFSLPTYLAALPAGIRYNTAHPLKYLAEWISAARPASLLRLSRSGKWPRADRRSE